MRPIQIEEYFKYHPPTTDKRKAAHEAINTAALDFAKTIAANVTDPDCLKMAMFAVQQARMFANQGITIDEIRGSQEKQQEELDRVMGASGDPIRTEENPEETPVDGWTVYRYQSGYKAELWVQPSQRFMQLPVEAWIYFASVNDATKAIEKERAKHWNSGVES